MAVLSKFSTSTIVTFSALSVAAWAVWYDHYRRSKPSYLDDLVERRRNELLENRKKNDPLYLVKSLPLCENPSDPMAIQEFSMTLMTQGEMELPTDYNSATSKIALGLAYFPAQQIQMILMQLSQAMEAKVIMDIKLRLDAARARVQTQRIEAMMNAQKAAQEKAAEAQSSLGRLENRDSPVIKEVEASDDHEPKDVDSIDGDSEERIIEVEEGEVEKANDKEPVVGQVEAEEEIEVDDLVADDIDSDSPNDQKDQEIESKISEAIQDQITEENTVEEENTLPESQLEEDASTETIELVEQDQVVEIQDTISEHEILEVQEEVKEETQEEIQELVQTEAAKQTQEEAQQQSEEESNQPQEIIQEIKDMITPEGGDSSNIKKESAHLEEDEEDLD